MRIVQIDIGGERIFQYGVVTVAPWHDEILAGRQSVRQFHRNDLVVSLVDVERAGMIERSEQNGT